MRFVHLAVLAGAVGLTLACDGAPKTDGLDTFDTGEPATQINPNPVILAIDPSGCANGASNSFDFAIETDGWIGGAILTIWDTSYSPALDEEHVMDHGAFDPDDPSFDIWELSLAEGTAPSNYVPGQNTVFNCVDATDPPPDGAYTYAIEIFRDQALSDLADCAVYGHNPPEVISGAWPDNGADNFNGTIIGNRFSSCLNFN